MIKKGKEVLGFIRDKTNFMYYSCLLKARYVTLKLFGKEPERKPYFERTKHGGPNKLLLNFLENNDSDGLIKEVIEIGIGTGNDTTCMLQKGWNVTGIDQTKESNYYVKSKKHGNGKFSFLQQNFDSLSLGENKFDLCYSHNTLSFAKIEQLEEIIDKIYNTLKDGGYLVINFFGKEEAKMSDIMLLTEDEIKKILGNKFQIASIQDEKIMRTNNLLHHAINVIAKKI